MPSPEKRFPAGSPDDPAAASVVMGVRPLESSTHYAVADADGTVKAAAGRDGRA
jgi:hypothetical protein